MIEDHNNYCYYTHSTEYCNLIGQRPWNNSRYSTALEGDVLNNIATSGYYEEYVATEELERLYSKHNRATEKLTVR